MSAIRNWALTSSADEFLVVIIILMVVCIGSFIASFRFLHRKRLLEDTPTSKIRSAAQGYLELHGHGALLDGPPVVAPLTRTTCTWYSYSIEERRRSGKNTSWVTVKKGSSDDLFLLIDETGRCIIDPDGACVTPKTVAVWYGSQAWPDRGPVGKSRLLTGGGRYRYTERRMHPHETLYAIGLFKTVGTGADLDVNDDVRNLLVEWKRDSEEMLRKFDANRDGQIDLEEWERVREAALNLVLQQHREFYTIPALNIMCRTHDHRKPYILSAIPQTHLVRRYRFYAAGLLVAFFIAGGFSTWLLTLRLGSV